MGRSLLDRFRGGSRTSARVGLSISDRAVALVQLTDLAAEKPVVRALKRLEVAADTRLADLLGKAVGELRLANTPCTLTLAPGEYQTFQIDKPPVEAEELHAAARWRIRELLDYPVDDAIIDVYDVPAQTQRGRPPSVVVVAARKTDLKPRIDLIEAAGLIPDRIDIAELAVRNLGTRLAGENESLALLLFAETRGLIAITRGERLYVSRGVNYGYEDLRREIAPASADGLALAGRADAFYDQIALEVQRTMDYFESYFGLGAAQRLVVGPGLPEFAELTGAVGQTLGVRVAEALDVGALIDTQIQAEAMSECLLALGGALGLPPGGEA